VNISSAINSVPPNKSIYRTVHFIQAASFKLKNSIIYKEDIVVQYARLHI